MDQYNVMAWHGFGYAFSGSIKLLQKVFFEWKLAIN